MGDAGALDTALDMVAGVLGEAHRGLGQEARAAAVKKGGTCLGMQFFVFFN